MVEVTAQLFTLEWWQQVRALRDERDQLRKGITMEYQHAAKIARTLIDGVVWEGGATVNPRTAEVSQARSGYLVGGAGPSVKVKNLSESVAERYVIDNAKYVDTDIRSERRPFVYYGAWDDGQHVYLDLSEHYVDYGEAMRVARRRGELAIWDVAAKHSLDVPSKPRPIEGQPELSSGVFVSPPN